MQIHEPFRKWLKEVKLKKNGQPLIESTINCYINTLENISDDMMRSGVIEKNLYNVLSPNEIDHISNNIKTNNDFIYKNQRGHNRHNSALDHYIEFIHSK